MSKINKNLVGKGIAYSLAVVTAPAIVGTSFAVARMIRREAKMIYSEAINEYRHEELEKVKEAFDNGEISQSEFEIRVAYINSLQNSTIVDEFISGHTEYEECKVKYEMVKDYDIAALTCAGAGVATAFLTAAVLNKIKKTSHENEERRNIQRNNISREL